MTCGNTKTKIWKFKRTSCRTIFVIPSNMLRYPNAKDDWAPLLAACCCCWGFRCTWNAKQQKQIILGQWQNRWIKKEASSGFCVFMCERVCNKWNENSLNQTSSHGIGCVSWILTEHLMERVTNLQSQFRYIEWIGENRRRAASNGTTQHEPTSMKSRGSEGRWRGRGRGGVGER